jgi:hypothetical protein
MWTHIGFFIIRWCSTKMGDLMAHSSAPCHKFFSNIRANSLRSFSLCMHHFILSLATLSLPILVLVIQQLCVLHWGESLFRPYHCLINWTNISCSVFPYFQILLDVLVLDFNVFFSCLNALYKLAFFPSAICLYFFQVHFEVHSQSCESNCQLHCMCVPLSLSLHRTTRLPLGRFLWNLVLGCLY